MTVSGDRTDNRRARILAVARKHFGRFGFRRAVLDDMATEAGCAKGSLYLEFTSKQALYNAVLADVHAEVGKRFAAEVADITSAAEWLRASLRFTFATLEREPLLARLLADDPEVHDWLEGWLFAQAGPIYAGSNEIQRNIIAERMLGLPKS